MTDNPQAISHAPKAKREKGNNDRAQIKMTTWLHDRQSPSCKVRVNP